MSSENIFMTQINWNVDGVIILVISDFEIYIFLEAQYINWGSFLGLQSRLHLKRKSNLATYDDLRYTV